MPTDKRVKAADRTIDLFEAFDKSGRPLSLSELAAAMEIPISSCHGLVNTLVTRGYLSPVGRQRAYYPTRLLFELGRNILARDPVLSRVTPLLEGLRDKCGETVVLARRLDRFAQYLLVLEANKTIRFSAQTSVLRSLHSSALGKALLGSMPEPKRTEIANSLDYERVTSATLPTAKRLLADVAAGEARGWHLTRGESVSDVAAVARSVLLAGEYHAVAIAGPLVRMEPMLEKHARLLASVGAEMEAASR
ncbi:IclR family transcriptional regulator [Ramlibacter terrae]|uniref:IclR family transcriptional regulator n=1 Tax=Ramlibacter terrae TaxID=2732511 RepID=A0ABX6NZW0_9BURK|nr:IclR family transcriptional regulator [Ramlibacter terrae]